MRKKILFLIYFMWNVTLSAQSTYFDKYFSTPNLGLDEGNSVIQLPSHNYLICGAEFDYPSFYLRTLIIKINSNGDTLWSKIISTDTVGLNPITMKQTKPNEFIVGGTAQIVKNNHDNVFNMSIDSNGNINWLKYVSPPAGLNAAFDHDMIITEKGEIIDIGDISDTSYGFDTSLAYVVKNDPFGNVIWQKTFGGPEFTDTRALSGIECDKGLIIVGETDINDNFEIFDGYISEIDSNGNLLWEKIYGNYNKENVFSTITKLPDNNYLLGGLSQPLNVYRMWLVKIDSLGDTIWSKTYGADTLGAGYFQTCKVINDGNIILIGGESGVKDIRLHGLIMKVSQNGDSLWKHDFHYPNDNYDDYFYGFQQTSDTGFIIAGDCHPTIVSVWLLKLDKYGCDSIGCSSVTGISPMPKNFSISIYPNPVASTLNVMLSLSKHEILQPIFRITNMLGQTVLLSARLELTSGNEYNFDVSNLPVGIYFLTIKASEGEITEKFVKE